MTLPTVPLVDGAFYWVRVDGAWWPAIYQDGYFYRPGKDYSDTPAAISGPIPTPDEVE